MQFMRKLYHKVEKYIDHKEIIAVTGMRRCGKTTLLKMIFENIKSANKVFLDLDNILEQKIFEEDDANNIWKNLSAYGIKKDQKAYIFIDEIQSMPPAVKKIKYLYDHYDVKFFITGSSSFYLKNLFPESLSGRKFIFELYPLSFEEFLIFKGINREFPESIEEKDKAKNKISAEKYFSLYQEYMKFGGFPQVVLSDSGEHKKMLLKDIFNSFFEKDVRILTNYRDLGRLRDFILLCMQHVGSRFEISRLSAELGVARDTVYNYLSFLESTYFIFLLQPFSRNVDREVSGSRKLYMCDTGFVSQYAKVSEGAIFENSVYLNLRHYGELNYYQKRRGGEIDFLLNKETAFEVKLTATPADLKKLKKLAIDLDLKDNYLVSGKFSGLDKTIFAIDL